ncbi:Prohibitin-1, subunit of the prohibitin complex (Phb1p-Phb2p) [Saguinus oedipus]|uniref:Prohibitin n=1 Tax=Saguinus oedipus TaxID=9490 RepID=A0ABQ9UWC3_SAGOE|nr:Prohibitin-1, subunit of the prohibitin complex (Phb1p-Phb2p) [Saguinus oedipus]
MAAKVFASIGKFGLALAVAGGLVNSALFIMWMLGTEPSSLTDSVEYRTLCKNLQIVNITLRILFRPVASQLSRIVTSIRGNHDERVLPSITTEILKSVVARFDAGELITWGELVSRQVNGDLTDQAATFGLILDDVSLTHLTFGKEFTEVVEANQVAQQEAEKARFVVEKAEQQKKAAIISAEGDSKAAKLITNSLATAGDSLVEMCKLEAAEDIAYQPSDSQNSTCLLVGQFMLLQLPR